MTEITYAIEPNRLKVIWQAVNSTVRTKFVVGELVRSGASISLSYFRLSSDFVQARQAGFVGHPAFPIEQPVHHFNVIEILSKRIPPRQRSDFQVYLAKNRLGSINYISDFALLGYTGGHLPSDGFSFAIDFMYENLPHQFMMEVAGFRYYAGMNLEITEILGQGVYFEADDSNEYDPCAVKILMQGHHLGFVPRYYSPLFRFWLNNLSVVGFIERIEGTLTKPQVFLMLFVQSNPSRPHGYLL